MKTAWLDVHLEVQVNDIADVQSPDWWRQAFESSKRTADAMAAEKGGHVDATVRPQVTTRWGEHVLLGGDWLLLGTRWRAEVPDSADTP